MAKSATPSPRANPENMKFPELVSVWSVAKVQVAPSEYVQHGKLLDVTAARMYVQKGRSKSPRNMIRINYRVGTRSTDGAAPALEYIQWTAVQFKSCSRSLNMDAAGLAATAKDTVDSLLRLLGAPGSI
eukprot:SAG11_NODE_1054_length_6018_cov_2.481250_6_plen_128_part_01